MKLINTHKSLVWTTLAALSLLVIGCLEFDSISQPERALVGSEINITAKLKIVPETDGSGRVIFAILAPKAWDLANNASLTLTSINYGELQGGTDVTNEVLSLIPSTSLEPNTKTTWAQAFKTVKGIDKNANLEVPVDVEWVAWWSSSSFKIDDKVNKEPVYADVKIKLTVGDDPVFCHMGYSYCYESYGLKAGENRDASAFRPITTYTSVISTTPPTFRYGDIFGVQFTRKDTPLENATEIYLCGTAVYDNGKTAEVKIAGPTNRMETINSKLSEKYIYPKQFFNLPADAVIEEVRVYFSNADGSVTVTDGDKGFLIEQADE